MAGRIGLLAAPSEKMSVMPKDPERFQWIDSCRALAAVTVLVAHLTPYSSKWFSTFIFGNVAVYLFFLVSGYVIPSSIGLRPSRNPVVEFVVRRGFRIYPVYWLSIALAVIVAAEPVSTWKLITNLFLAQKLFGVDSFIFVYWTLFIEFIFYGLSVFMYMIGVVRSDRIDYFIVIFMMCTITAAVAERFLHVHAPVGIMLYLLLMLVGCWLRLGSSKPSRVVAMILAIMTTQAIGCVLFYSDGFRDGLTGSEMFLKQFGTVLLFMALSRARFMEASALVHIGRISYPMYVLHVPVTVGMSYLLPADHSYLVLWTYLAVFAVSEVAHYALEQPCIDLGRRLIAKKLRA